MLRLIFILVLLFPALISAQCAACDSYTAALQSCQTTSANDTAVGTTIDSTTIHCMCSSKSNYTDMNACTACYTIDPSATLDFSVLSAWALTCTADGQFGDQQAAECWQSQPDNVGPCLSKTGGSSFAGGDAITTTQPSVPKPTTTAKSAATLSLQPSVLLSVLLPALLLGLGILAER
ncbi:hypothetical protein BDR22DRAFT_890883 [Usnea florida]